MALARKYYGELLALGEVAWKVEIFVEGFTGAATEVRFPHDSPLVIEWSETSKLDPLQPSHATLTLISDTSFEFLDLYSVGYGNCRLDVYRHNGTAYALYWSGCIDPELYEEPYRSLNGYDVTLTFSDLAPLDVASWQRTGLSTIADIVDACIAKTGVLCGTTEKHISTMISTTALTLQEVSVNQDNFYDEEGEAKTMREVLTEVLRPFALRIVQKAGRFVIYDLQSAYQLTASNVQWDGDDASLSMDAIYNNVKVTFSPYAEAKMMEGTVTRDDSLGAQSGSSSGYQSIRVYKDYERDQYAMIAAPVGFWIHWKSGMTSNMTIDSSVRFFQINTVNSGDECEGVISFQRSGDYPVRANNTVNPATSAHLVTPANPGSSESQTNHAIITCPRVYLGYSSISRNNYRLRISLDLLFDVRYNPFEDASENNDQDAYEDMKDWCNYGYVPIRLTLRNAAGTVLYHFENYRVMQGNGYDHAGQNSQWAQGDAGWGRAWLAYYDKSDLKSGTGFGGWRGNRPIIGYYRGDLPRKWEGMDDGEYIDLPPVGGFLHLEIGNGIHQFDYGREVKPIYQWVRWLAYKSPSITLCDINGKEAEMKDIEDTAWLNASAKESLTIDTLVGTAPAKYGVPNGKGQIYGSDRSILTQFTRHGTTARLERLLIGTVYSQYAGRHIVLSGTTVLLPSFGIYGDAVMAGKFILLSERQDIRSNTSEIRMVQFDEDNYMAVEV